MISFFTVARAFAGHTGLVQRNALRSWRRLHHDCEVVLIGDDGGSADVAREYGFIHVPHVPRTEHGSMLVSAVFREAEAHSRHDLLCYVSADIVLLSDFTSAALQMRSLHRPFLMGGRRCELDVREELTFDDGWEERLRRELVARGRLGSPECVDYFLFTRGLLGEIPPFAIGRKRWDRWIQCQARSGPGLYVDGTEAVTAIHQNHDYGLLGFAAHKRGPESQRNIELAGDRFCDLRQAGLKLTTGGLRPAIDWTRIKWRLERAVAPLSRSIGRMERFVRATRGIPQSRRLVRASKAARRFLRSGNPGRQERVAVIGLRTDSVELAVRLADKGYIVTAADAAAPSMAETGWRGAAQAGAVDRVVAQARTRPAVEMNAERAIHKANVIVLATQADRADPGSLVPACQAVGAALSCARGYRLVVVVSTVAPGWFEGTIQPTLERISGRRAGIDFGLCYWPLALLTGHLAEGTPSPTFTLIGESDLAAGKYLARMAARVYKGEPIIRTSLANAEIVALAVARPAKAASPQRRCDSARRRGGSRSACPPLPIARRQ